MDIARSWLVAVVVYLVGATVTATLGIGARVTEEDLTGGGAITWNALPTALTFLLMTLLARAVHPDPARRRPLRHAIASLGAPVVLTLLGVVLGAVQQDWNEMAVSTAAALVGTGVGWALGLLLRRPSRSY
ncbi:hypothetical protein GCM10009678_50480 [Actinomadura kijaniata]|uniref:Uncharacterized protein n=1 Tax=Actinomadura namibiensis TaxID=182080 RepID=A0A7W3QIR4_ACTNM|nr:hypothetical protein [Actinomadura namibiensis]MBA8948580.1 hypothetical protein [Actinomadura namibiensis]